MKTTLSLLLSLSFLAAPAIAEEPFADEKSENVFQSYESWAKSQAGAAIIEKLETKFWGDEENEAFVNKLIDWGNTKTIPKTNTKLGKVIFLANSDLKSKVAEKVGAFGSVAKIWETLEIVDRIAAGEWQEVMQEQAGAMLTTYVTEAITGAVPVLGQVKLAYDIAKIGYDAFMNEIYDLNVQQLYKRYSESKMDWETFQESFQKQLGYGDAPMDQFVMEFAAKNGYSGMTKEDFAGFKDEKRKGTATINSITRILYNKFKEQRQKELAAAAAAKNAKADLEETAMMAAVAEKQDSIREAVRHELEKKAREEYERQKVQAEKWIKWQEKSKQILEDEARARKSAVPETRPKPVQIPFSGFKIPDPGKLVAQLDGLIADGAHPRAYDSVWDGFWEQIRKLEEGFKTELALAEENIAKATEEQNKSYQQRLNAVYQAKASCIAEAKSRAQFGTFDQDAANCVARETADRTSVERSFEPIWKQLDAERVKLPRLDLEPLYKRRDYWEQRYSRVMAVNDATQQALRKLSIPWNDSPFAMDLSGRTGAAEGEADSIEDIIGPQIDNIKANHRDACADPRGEAEGCAAALRFSVKGAGSTSPDAVDEEDPVENAKKHLEEFRKEVAKAKAAWPLAQKACQALYAVDQGTVWGAQTRGDCKASLENFNEKAMMAEEIDKAQVETIAKIPGTRALYENAKAALQAFVQDVEGAAATVDRIAAARFAQGGDHPYDWLKDAGQTGNLSMTYLPGLDAALLESVRAEVAVLLGAVDGALTPGPKLFLSNLQGALKSVKPTPKEAWVVNDGLVTPQDMADIAASANLIDPASKFAVNHTAGLRNSLQSMLSDPQNLPSGHPVLAGYNSALAAIETAERRVEVYYDKQTEGLRKKGEALSASIKKLKASAEKRGAAALPEVKKLQKELDELIKELDAVSGKVRDESGADTQQMKQDLLECESLIEDAVKEKKQDDAKAKLKAIEAQMSKAAPAQIADLMTQASKIANEAGIGGDPEVVDLMGRLAETAMAKTPKGGAPTGPAVTVKAADSAGQSAATDAMDELNEIKRYLSLPGRAEEHERLLERARQRVEGAEFQLQEADPKNAKVLFAPLQAALRELEALAKKNVHKPAAGTAGDPQKLSQVQALYQKFAGAFNSKDLQGVLACLTPDWESSEGTTIDDMEKTLSNSFSVFDAVKMEFQGLRINALPDGRYSASYTTRLTGTIRQNDIEHQEQSTHQDTVEFTPDGPKISRTAGSTAWVQ